MIAELATFLWHLQQWPIPEELRCELFGITHYHHPEILDAISQLTPEARLLELIDAVIWFDHSLEPPGKIAGPKRAEFTCTAATLEKLLVESQGFGHEARKLLSWHNATGAYLGRLAKSHPGRVQSDRSDNARQWILIPPPPMTP